MTIAEVRKKYLEFFRKRGHVIIPSASLVPENDTTTLFTGSGMQPLVPYLLGQTHPAGVRLANSQKCFRSEDIEEVGDNRHTTFFEMLGNWSLGDPSTGVRTGYWKAEQLAWIFEFLTEELGIPKERLWATYFAGDEKLGLPPDAETAAIWEKIGLPKARILPYGAEKNWWSRSGTLEKMPIGEPGGPDSEIFFDFDPAGKRGLHKAFAGVKLLQTRRSLTPVEECHPNCDCSRFMEIGNSVFMEYRRNPSSPQTRVLPLQKGELNPSPPEADAPFSKGRISPSAFEKLPQRNVDFGGGLERITAAVNDEPDIFQLDVFVERIRAWEKESGKSYTDEKNQRAFRIVADHARAAEMLMKDGVAPSNLGQGYVLRRLLRRAILFADRLGVQLDERFREEEKKFRRTLEGGMRELERILTPPNLPSEEGRKILGVGGREAFLLFSTFGFPIDMTVDLARERGVAVDTKEFQKEFEKHREVSRVGADKKFKGGLADTSEMSIKYHTATHLLHQALRDVLGEEVRQKGSNITPERLRFDFAFSRKPTDQEKKKVEDRVNQKIKADLPVRTVTLPLEDAKKTGALHFFWEKYGEQVNVHYIGDSLESAYSKEFCGGPHVARTGVLGTFKISKEEAVGAGVRRIKALLS